jgi:hypothetical protein
LLGLCEYLAGSCIKKTTVSHRNQDPQPSLSWEANLGIQRQSQIYYSILSLVLALDFNLEARSKQGVSKVLNLLGNLPT